MRSDLGIAPYAGTAEENEQSDLGSFAYDL